jgi:hypothetical protein
MDTPTATIIAAFLSSGASIAVAWITTRNRIGVPQTSSEPRVESTATQSTSVGIFRTLGWVLVGYLYFMSAICFGVVIESLFIHEEPYQSYSTGYAFLFGAPMFFIARWAHKRLRRRQV